MGTSRADRVRARLIWVCPDRGNQYVNRSSWHSCGQWTLEHHFSGRPRARAVFDAFKASLEADGPITMQVSKTRIAFMTRVRFAGVLVRKDSIYGTLWLTRRVEGGHVANVETYGPLVHVHYLLLRLPSDVDQEVRAMLAEARRVGNQEHLVDRGA